MNSPVEILKKLTEAAIKKSSYSFKEVFILSILAGMFIALGAIFFITVTVSSDNFGLFKLIGGVSFSLGLILVVLTGAELFTGNNLMLSAIMEKKIKFSNMIKNWSIVYIGNLIGSLTIVFLVYAGGHHLSYEGKLGFYMVSIAESKVELSFLAAIAKGILCNILVCLAVLTSLAATTVTGKVLTIIFPISAFVAMGFEHSVANMFFIPMGMIVQGSDIPSISIYQFLISNLLPVTIGNIIGGSLFTGLLYQQAWSKKAGANS